MAVCFIVANSISSNNVYRRRARGSSSVHNSKFEEFRNFTFRKVKFRNPEPQDSFEHFMFKTQKILLCFEHEMFKTILRLRISKNYFSKRRISKILIIIRNYFQSPEAGHFQDRYIRFLMYDRTRSILVIMYLCNQSCTLRVIIVKSYYD